jgi:hypothetical protein
VASGEWRVASHVRYGMEVVGLSAVIQGFFHCVNDTVLIFFAQERVHRETDDLFGGRFRGGEVAHLVAEAGEDRLFVQALRVINRGRHALLFQLGPECFTVRHTNGVLRVDVDIAGAHFGSLANITQQFRVTRADPAASFHLGREVREFNQHHRRLQRVEAAIHAQHCVVMTLPAVRADIAHARGQMIVIAEERTAIPEATERFRGEETGAADRRHGAAFASVLRSAETLGAVLKHRQMMLGRDAIDFLVVRHLTEKADRHDGLGARSDGRLELGHVHVVVHGIDIHEDGLGADEPDGLGGTDPREGHRDHFVARTDLQGAQGDFEAVRSAGDRDGMLHPGEFGQGCFQFPDLGAHYELPVIKHRPHAGVDLRLVATVLLVKVDELHGAFERLVTSKR